MPTAGVTSDHTGRRRPGMRAPESRGRDTRDDGDGFLIFDVVESREAFKQFGKTMGTLPQEVGITEGLKLFEAHTFLSSLRLPAIPGHVITPARAR